MAPSTTLSMARATLPTWPRRMPLTRCTARVSAQVHVPPTRPRCPARRHPRPSSPASLRPTWSATLPRRNAPTASRPRSTRCPHAPATFRRTRPQPRPQARSTSGASNSRPTLTRPRQRRACSGSTLERLTSPYPRLGPRLSRTWRKGRVWEAIPHSPAPPHRTRGHNSGRSV